MEEIIIKYDARNTAARKLIDFILSSKLVKVEKVKKSALEEAIEEIDNGDVYSYDNFEDFQKDMRNLTENEEIVAYTADGEPLTLEQYQKRVNAGIEQCIKGESISLEDLSKELGYMYADL